MNRLVLALLLCCLAVAAIGCGGSSPTSLTSFITPPSCDTTCSCPDGLTATATGPAVCGESDCTDGVDNDVDGHTDETVAIVGTAASFTGAASGGILPYTNFAWDFGDGVGTSAVQNPNYTYTAAGTYTVTFTVTDSCGATGSDSFPVTVCATALMVTVNTNDGTEIAIVNVPRGFNAFISGTPPYTILWDFGDGGTSTLEDPIYTYVATGPYTVTLTVTDACGLTAADSFVITVCSPGLTITADTQDGIKTATVNVPRGFSGTVTGGVVPFTFQWNFGDGGTITVVGGAAEDVIYTYLTGGNYTVTLTVTDLCGVFTIDSFPITVSN